MGDLQNSSEQPCMEEDLFGLFHPPAFSDGDVEAAENGPADSLRGSVDHEKQAAATGDLYFEGVFLPNSAGPVAKPRRQSGLHTPLTPPYSC